MYDKVPIHPLSSCGGPLQNQRAGSGDEGHLLHYTDCWGTTWDSVQRQILTFQNTFGNCTEWIKIRRKCRHPHHLTHRSAHSWSHLLIFCLKKKKRKKIIGWWLQQCLCYIFCIWLIDVLLLQSVEAFIKDWKPKAKYKAAYIYFTDCKWDRAGRVSDDYLYTNVTQSMG